MRPWMEVCSSTRAPRITIQLETLACSPTDAPGCIMLHSKDADEATRDVVACHDSRLTKDPSK